MLPCYWTCLILPFTCLCHDDAKHVPICMYLLGAGSSQLNGHVVVLPVQQCKTGGTCRMVIMKRPYLQRMHSSMDVRVACANVQETVDNHREAGKAAPHALRLCEMVRSPDSRATTIMTCACWRYRSCAQYLALCTERISKMCLSPCFDGQDAFFLVTSGTGRMTLKSKLHSRITDAQLGTTLLSEVYCMRCPCKCSMRSGLLV